MSGDYQTYVGPPPAPDTLSPNYPRWMYHPVKPAQIVVDSTAEAALVASDASWSETDPNATT
jgi:hypothetical protein